MTTRVRITELGRYPEEILADHMDEMHGSEDISRRWQWRYAKLLKAEDDPVDFVHRWVFNPKFHVICQKDKTDPVVLDCPEGKFLICDEEFYDDVATAMILMGTTMLRSKPVFGFDFLNLQTNEIAAKAFTAETVDEEDAGNSDDSPGRGRDLPDQVSRRGDKFR